MQASIIGFGNFGKLAAKHLIKKGIDISISDVLDKSGEVKEIGGKFVSLEEACKNKIIILAVPMENFKEVLERINEKLSPGTLVIDVCSLKMFSCDLMKKILPKHVEIIGTHPLFGPQSAPESIKGMRIVLINVRAKNKTFEGIKEFCKNLELKIIETTTEKHDEQMAFSQALTHFIGQICKRNNIKRVEMSTKTFDDLMDIVDIIKNDTPALFSNMQCMNPFAKQARDKFVEEAEKLNDDLNSESGRNKNG